MAIDKEKFVEIQSRSRVITAEFFKLICDDAVKNGQEHADAFLYTLVGSIITTHLYARVNSQKTLTAAGDAYITEKRCIETMIQKSFEQLMARMNPGTTPEFECNVTLLDEGIEGMGKSN